MQEIEVNRQVWKALKQALMNSKADQAMSVYPSPVKVYCGKEYVIYKRGDEDYGEEQER